MQAVLNCLFLVSMVQEVVPPFSLVKLSLLGKCRVQRQADHSITLAYLVSHQHELYRLMFGSYPLFLRFLSILGANSVSLQLHPLLLASRAEAEKSAVFLSLTFYPFLKLSFMYFPLCLLMSWSSSVPMEYFSRLLERREFLFSVEGVVIYGKYDQ